MFWFGLIISTLFTATGYPKSISLFNDMLILRLSGEKLLKVKIFRIDYNLAAVTNINFVNGF